MVVGATVEVVLGATVLGADSMKVILEPGAFGSARGFTEPVEIGIVESATLLTPAGTKV